MMRFFTYSVAGISLSVSAAVGLSTAHTMIVEPGSVNVMNVETAQRSVPVTNATFENLVAENVTHLTPGSLDSVSVAKAIVGSEIPDAMTMRPRVRPTDQVAYVAPQAQIRTGNASGNAPVRTQQVVQTRPVAPATPGGDQNLGNVWMVGVYR